MKPIVQALLLADHIYTDAKTGKKIIAGTFERVLLGKDQPITKEEQRQDGSKVNRVFGGTDPGCPSVYVNMTDVVNNTKITLQFVNVSKNKAVFGMDLAVQCHDRFAHVQIDVPLPPLRQIVPEPGVYSMDILWEGEIIGSYRIQAIAMKQENATEGVDHVDD